MVDSVAGPSRIPAPDLSRDSSVNGDRSRSGSVAETSMSPDKGKSVERPLTTIALPHTTAVVDANDPGLPTAISPWRAFSPKPRAPSPSLIMRGFSSIKRPRSRSPVKYDSSDPDHISQAPLPPGRLLTPSPPPPPLKKAKPAGPPPLPEGPASVQTLHVLLHPEHVEQNRPKRLFDLVRSRETRKPIVSLSPAELKDVLGKMKKVHEIWLRTMGEDVTCLGCLAMWLKQFINNPKMFEGSVVPLLWVILRAKPSNEKMRAARLHTLAKQALAQADKNNLSIKGELEQAVKNLDKLVDMHRQAKALASGEGSESKPSLPSFKKNVSGPSTATSNSARPDSSAPTVPPPAAAPQEMTPLQKIMADASAASAARERAAREAAADTSNTHGRPPPPPPPPINPSARTANGPTPSSSPGFRAAPGPVPMSIDSRSSGDAAGPSTTASYPSATNKWSSMATEAALQRPFDHKKRPNWRNRSIRYRDGSLAEARPFEMADYEAEEPDWWLYATKNTDAHGHSTSELDQAEGHTMRDLAVGGPQIDWYEPTAYETPNSTVGPVITPEVQAQDIRERGLLSTYYASPRDIPPTPEESTRVVDFVPYQSLLIPPLPPVWIPPPQPMPFNAQSRQGSINHTFTPPGPSTPSSSSSFRPRNGAAPIPPPNASGPSPSSSSAYRPRASSAPAGPQPTPEAIPRRASTPGPSGPPAPKPKTYLPPSGNPPPIPDRARTNHSWSRQAKPRKSALLNPLTPAQLDENLKSLAEASPVDYSRFDLDDDMGGPSHGHPPAQSRGGASKQ